MEQPLVVGSTVPPIPEDTGPLAPRRKSSSGHKLTKSDRVGASDSTDYQMRPPGVATPTDPAVKAALTERRKSLVPMSSMEEENLRERLHLAQLKQCSEIVSVEAKYNKDSFRRLFFSKV